MVLIPYEKCAVIPTTLTFRLWHFTCCFATEGDQQQCLQAGCNAYLAKPFSSEQFFMMIEDFLAHRESESFSEIDIQRFLQEFQPKLMTILK